MPAAFGRLCVETPTPEELLKPYDPAAFGRLCVETARMTKMVTTWGSSRLRAAVC